MFLYFQAKTDILYLVFPGKIIIILKNPQNKCQLSLQGFASNRPQIASTQQRFVRGWQLNLPEIPAATKPCEGEKGTGA